MEKMNVRNVSEVLSDKELKNVLGGLNPPPLSSFACACNSAGANVPYRSSWTAQYGNSQDMANDLYKICKTGGSCKPVQAIQALEVTDGSASIGHITVEYNAEASYTGNIFQRVG